MRIGIDARLWNESGVGRYIRNLVSELKKLDKKNEYVLFVKSKDTGEILKKAFEAVSPQAESVQDDNFKVVKADIRWHTIEEQLRFPSVLNKEKLDLVHFPYFSVPIFYNRPFIITIHDLILHHFPTGEASTLPFPLYWLKQLGYRFIISQAAKRAKKIIAVSNATKSEIIDHLGVKSEKIVVTYEGVNINSKFKIHKQSLSSINSIRQLADKSKKHFLYVGNAYPHKNLERLVEAFARIRNNESRQRRGSPGAAGIKLVLVGKEDYFYKRLKEKVKSMNLKDSVIFYGEASDEELAGLYKSALALVMPSFMEGFGLPTLEAMANKCLVLASDTPSLREICQDAAVYFNPYDIDEMVEIMRDVCFNDSNHFNKNIERGWERTKVFSWEKMAKETLKIYDSSIDSESW